MTTNQAPANSISGTIIRMLAMEGVMTTDIMLWHVGASMREARPDLERLLAEGRIVRTIINDNVVWALAPDAGTKDCGR